MKKLEIEIPNDKEIDWEASAKQKQIVFKDKQLTYEDVCKKLFTDNYWYLSNYGTILKNGIIDVHVYEPNNASTKHQLECILAKNMLANTARFLNGEWKEYENDHSSIYKYIIWYSLKTNTLVIEKSHNYVQYTGNIIFKSEELAQQAIEILGEETVKLALTPLY